jgi:hypothetical protein
MTTTGSSPIATTGDKAPRGGVLCFLDQRP